MQKSVTFLYTLLYQDYTSDKMDPNIRNFETELSVEHNGSTITSNKKSAIKEVKQELTEYTATKKYKF